MQITLSAAVTADGYMDDQSPERLVISTPGDWTEVYRLRAVHDAILVGAETLRRDNPSLLIRDESVRHDRVAWGLRPDIAKVTLTMSGDLSPALRFFTIGDADRYVFSLNDIPDLKDIATVISTSAPISAGFLVTQLEKRGINSLFVEGGVRTLGMFLAEGMADTLRLAVNPALILGAERGGAHFAFSPSADTPCLRETIDGMEVATYTLRPNTSTDDLHYLHMAIEMSRQCVPSPTSYCVGAVVVAADGRMFTGYTHETSPTHHAEQEAIAKAVAASAPLRGASIYASMEPCSERRSEPESCSAIIRRHGFAHVAFAYYEPDCFVCCQGAELLRAAGIDVRVYPELAEEVRRVNAHLPL